MGKLSVDLNGLELKNPIMTASGTYGYASEYNDFIDVSNLGAVVTKAISLYPRAGNKHLRITETKAGMINSIGLENVGIEKFIEIKLPELKENNIDFVMSLPWNEMSDDSNDIVEAKKILDEDHYGLNKVKDRILEYLAVKIMMQKNPQTILCLVGPPGVGKTSLAKSIARALNKKFVKFIYDGKNTVILTD